MKVKVYNQTGQDSGLQAELPQKVFGLTKVRPELVHMVVTALRANARKSFAATKTKGEVRGGGKKPWQQKGTGRARAGSIRSPLWRGGGVTFGPRPDRNFSRKISKKLKRLALISVLSDKAANNRVSILDKLDLQSGKTKDLLAFLKKLPQYQPNKRLMIVVATPNASVFRAARNLPKVRIFSADNLGILDVLLADQLLIVQAALPKLEKVK